MRSLGKGLLCVPLVVLLSSAAFGQAPNPPLIPSGTTLVSPDPNAIPSPPTIVYQNFNPAPYPNVPPTVPYLATSPNVPPVVPTAIVANPVVITLQTPNLNVTPNSALGPGQLNPDMYNLGQYTRDVFSVGFGNLPGGAAVTIDGGGIPGREFVESSAPRY
jgi:hypothetical protein